MKHTIQYIALTMLFSLFSSCAVDKPANENMAKPPTEDISMKCQDKYCKELYDSLFRTVRPYMGLSSNHGIDFSEDLFLRISASDKEKFANYADNCECWISSPKANVDGLLARRLFTRYQEELQKKQAEEKSINEIKALIEGGSIETSIIMDKCDKHQKAFKGTVQACDSIKYQQGFMLYQQVMPKLTALLKENKLEQLIEECKSNASKLSRVMLEDSLVKKYNDLCSNQLVSKVRKLPKNKINTIALAKIYYDGYQDIQAKIFHVFGEIAVAETIGYNKNISVQLSGSIGCNFQHSEYIVGYGKYLGMQSKTIMGTLPHYQLLWCDDGE